MKYYSSWGVKGTLMNVWKPACMFAFIQKQCSENFAFLILRILELFSREVCKMYVYKYTETMEYVKK